MRAVWALAWLAGCGTGARVADVAGDSRTAKTEGGSLIIDGGAAATTDRKVSVTLSAPGEPKKMCIGETGQCSDFSKFKATTQYKFARDDEGLKSLTAVVKYGDGSTLVLGPASILYDHTKPTDPEVSISSYGHTATLQWSGGFDQGGIVAQLISGPSASKEPKKCEDGVRLEGHQRLDFPDLPEGKWHFRVCNVDAAGNVSKGTKAQTNVVHEPLIAGPVHVNHLPVREVTLRNPGVEDTFTLSMGGVDADAFELIPGPYGVRVNDGVVATVPTGESFTFYVARREGSAVALDAEVEVEGLWSTVDVPVWSAPTTSLGLWFRADTLGVAEDEQVAVWEDHSGGYHDLWTYEGHSPPTFRHRYGIPGLEFPGAYAAMYQGDSFDFSASTILIAWKSMSNSDAEWPGLLNFGAEEHDYDTLNGLNLSVTGFWGTFSLYRNHDLSAIAAVEPGERSVLSARSGDGTGVVGVNGIDGVEDEYSSSEEIQSSGFVLNGRWLFGEPHWNGGNPTYHEVMFLTEKLDDAETREMECYLAARWQIAEHNGDCWDLRMQPVENAIMDLASLEAYYSADHVGDALLFADASFVEGDEVAVWSDLSGHERHVYGEAALPRFEVASANGMPALTFDDDLLAADPEPFIVGADPRTVVAVVRSLGQTEMGLGHIVHWGTTACNQAYGIATYPFGESFAGHYWCPVAVGGHFDTEDFQIVITEYDGATDRMYVNGSLVMENPIALNTGIAHGVHIGARIHPLEYGRFEVAEVAIFSEALDEWDRATVEAYLADKYAIEDPSLGSF